MHQIKISNALQLLALLGCAMFAHSTFAEWQIIDDNFLAKVYYDPNKMKKSTSYPEVWQMTDLKSRAESGAISRLILVQYDCVDKRRRTLASAGYYQHMAQGKPIFTDVSQGVWHPVLKDTVMNTILEMACAREEAGNAEEKTSKKSTETGKTLETEK